MIFRLFCMSFILCEDLCKTTYEKPVFTEENIVVFLCRINPMALSEEE